MEHLSGRRGAVGAVEHAGHLLEQVPDPEIPVVSSRELGILREISERDGVIEVVITPTYSGCPAMGQIEDDVRNALAQSGMPVTIVTRLAPAWTTDWISAVGRRKLAAYGIAPPAHLEPGAAVPIRFFGGRSGAARLACPRCGSLQTERLSAFGSTACKALYRCMACREPFEHFKPI